MPIGQHEQNVIIRKHIVDISEALGVALAETLRVSIYRARSHDGSSSRHMVLADTKDMRQNWRNLGERICDFGEYLDED